MLGVGGLGLAAIKILTMEFVILIFFNSTFLESARFLDTQDLVDTKQSALSAFCLFLWLLSEPNSSWTESC